MNIGRPASLALATLLLSAGIEARAQPAPELPPPAAGAPDTTDEDIAEEAPATSPAARGDELPRPVGDYGASYEARLRASFAASQGLLGPLDGSWRLALDRGGDVYAFELVDNGAVLEGAWRDLRRSGLTASGFVDGIQRLGGTVTLRFQSADGPAVLTLSARADGRWAGELVEGADHFAATLRRN